MKKFNLDKSLTMTERVSWELGCGYDDLPGISLPGIHKGDIGQHRPTENPDDALGYA